ncbi:MAG: TlyA family RNA methyltransferase [Desulfarculaceae bacterium]|nr:TlyA family RNA methyltransferase [Desulfarculaceae bacterium]MCF8048667.1 TlyA family RNA methyltransferase [Desulfarculaceae bacterium]MCF8098896.1 TlyA family RNA methyltransferase [Desulfarculaceae bacterium]MCF8120809.1 TlyA family RNA methyltransferase [Desulfarculaceae bacterium]
MAKGQRLDLELVARGLAPSRAKAQAMILAGLVKVDGRPAAKAGQLITDQAQVQVDGPEHPYVSRGGVKLAGALDHFGLAVDGLACLDVGASTGGFTDCLLQRGAVSATCVDVGYGQLAWKLRQDPRVTLFERTNARNLPPEMAPGPFGLIVVDVSFISLTLVLPPLVARLEPGGHLLPMVKPQFEAGREAVGPGGVVRDPALRQAAVDKVADCLQSLGLSVLGSAASSILGPKGNQEFFILAGKPKADGAGA